MSEPLQFDRAEYSTPEAQQCGVCGAGLVERYWVANGKPLCAHCHGRIIGQFNVGTPGGRFLAALGFGSAAAVAGAALYYIIRSATGYELGLVAIVVGLMVGFGVKRGARGRGGAGYQILAMGLTYLSIIATYVPLVLQGFESKLGHDAIGPFMIIFAVALSFVMPFLMIVKAPLSAVITGIALYEAWKVNKRPIKITGPHTLAPKPAAATATATGDAAKTSGSENSGGENPGGENSGGATSGGAPTDGAHG